ncbi:MAG TPA: hypothetical protein VK614_13535 [Allosphingosinicella sp.]|nr:hypothetical protein [Allosphingosinicella sp.]
MAAKERYIGYADFATVLLCPSRYAERHPKEAGAFSTVIHHDSIADYLPEFAEDQ